MAGELRARRRQLNLDRSHKALLICDFASQHSSKKYRHLKEQWMLQHNAETFIHSAIMFVPSLLRSLWSYGVNINVMCIYIYNCLAFCTEQICGPRCCWHTWCEDIVTGDSEEVQIPGGWGAAGGPNDGFHQYWHQLCGAYHRLAVCWGSSPGLRKRMDELHLSTQGSVATRSGLIKSTYIYIYMLHDTELYKCSLYT